MSARKNENFVGLWCRDGDDDRMFEITRVENVSGTWMGFGDELDGNWTYKNRGIPIAWLDKWWTKC